MWEKDEEGRRSIMRVPLDLFTTLSFSLNSRNALLNMINSFAKKESRIKERKNKKPDKGERENQHFKSARHSFAREFSWKQEWIMKSQMNYCKQHNLSGLVRGFFISIGMLLVVWFKRVIILFINSQLRFKLAFISS